MTFVSYAQNFEDVMLWRALKHVERGFYVDIGAQHPTDDSVSRAFYDRGWSGVNVEPVADYAALLRAERPRDVTLECAISDKVGDEPIYVVPGTGLSTLIREHAMRHRDSGDFAIEERGTTTRTLSDVLQEFATGDVHWLKIDVEGAEEQVLRSWQGSPSRPWVIVVESTRPNETREVHGTWEHILTEAGYRFVYFDGLNRFYVSPLHPELDQAFRVPRNVFDHFELAAIDRRETAFRRAETYAQGLRLALDADRAEADKLRRALDGERAEAVRRDQDTVVRFAHLEKAFKDAEGYAKSLEAEVRKVLDENRELTAFIATKDMATDAWVASLVAQRDRAAEDRSALQATQRERAGVVEARTLALTTAVSELETRLGRKASHLAATKAILEDLRTDLARWDAEPASGSGAVQADTSHMPDP